MCIELSDTEIYVFVLLNEQLLQMLNKLLCWIEAYAQLIYSN